MQLPSIKNGKIGIETTCGEKQFRTFHPNRLLYRSFPVPVYLMEQLM